MVNFYPKVSELFPNTHFKQIEFKINKGLKMEPERPSKDDYLKFIELEWADFHHSRLQEWTAFGIVAGIHLGIITLFDVFSPDDPSKIEKVLLLFGGIM